MKRSVTLFITTKLKLKVNEEKSAVDRPDNRKFLGYTIAGRREPRLKPAKQPIERLKAKVKGIFEKLDQWIRHRLRCII